MAWRTQQQQPRVCACSGCYRVTVQVPLSSSKERFSWKHPNASHRIGLRAMSSRRDGPVDQPPQSGATDQYMDFATGKLERWPQLADGCPFRMLDVYDRITRTFEFITQVEACALKRLLLRLPKQLSPLNLRLPRFGAAARTASVQPRARTRFRSGEVALIVERLARPSFSMLASVAPFYRRAVGSIFDRVFCTHRRNAEASQRMRACTCRCTPHAAPHFADAFCAQGTIGSFRV